MDTIRMKLVLLYFCFLHVVFVSAGIFTRNDLQTTYRSASVSKTQSSRSTGSLNQVRQRPLFARRGQYERQSFLRPRVPVIPNRPPTPPPPPPPPASITPPAGMPKPPVKAKCSQLGQSCLPTSGCCDPFTMCHCRFFNAICFCRRTNLHYNKDT